MTSTELSRLVGRRGVARWVTGSKDALLVPVVTLDARKAYGRVDVLVRPLAPNDAFAWRDGELGSAWISEEALELEEAAS
jgi:hypothetical protein